ncbi:hypothetical protein [uncultured Intestinimonas sp.]|uniref:hypothetical protein n=1 Tax=uncultured Intestinimonas sp. TaxID=1689265 RepID=UPI0025D0EF1D|nr:hypothetical protein [uncultured Intestinimonas sp.]
MDRKDGGKIGRDRQQRQYQCLVQAGQKKPRLERQDSRQKSGGNPSGGFPAEAEPHQAAAGKYKCREFDGLQQKMFHVWQGISPLCSILCRTLHQWKGKCIPATYRFCQYTTEPLELQFSKAGSSTQILHRRPQFL